MQSLGNILKRNAPVFILGLIILVIFAVIILSSLKTSSNIPAGFKKVEEEIFDERESAEPKPTLSENAKEEIVEIAPQIASPNNVGKPYFYGETNPTLRDSEGYPTPPSVKSTYLSDDVSQEEQNLATILEMEVYEERLKSIQITFTEDGFSPKVGRVYTGRSITWINKASRDIEITQTTPTQEALKNGVTIKPGESFTFRPLVADTLIYVETTSKEYGDIIVLDVTAPLTKEEN